jgi:hypothetical protein
LRSVRDSKFPKSVYSRIEFLADSLGGAPQVSLRTSRDICGEMRGRFGEFVGNLPLVVAAYGFFTTYFFLLSDELGWKGSGGPGNPKYFALAAQQFLRSSKLVIENAFRDIPEELSGQLEVSRAYQRACKSYQRWERAEINGKDTETLEQELLVRLKNLSRPVLAIAIEHARSLF